MTDTNNTDEVVRSGAPNPHTGQYETKVTLTLTNDTRQKVVLLRGNKVIPVIFVPGIMGTNLKVAGGSDIAWRPPNMDGVGSVAGALAQLLSYLFKDSADRQRELSVAKTEVDDRGGIDVSGSGITEVLARQRGWGKLMRSAYHPVMCKLQAELAEIVTDGGSRLGAWWSEHGKDVPADWGDTKGNAALTLDELKHAAHFSYDVWSGGYNWLQSNRDSGAAIGALIDNVIVPHYQEQKREVAKVVVVTHSMGGLVARALACITQHPMVAGVVHGVQPATGAAGTYKRMRAGFEGVEQVMLGRNAGEVTAVCCNAYGPLELLPTADYNEGKPWLKVRDVQTGSEPLALPASGDPYSEIYATDKWYGMVPKANEKWLDPAKMVKLGGEQTYRGALRDRVHGVKEFHEAITTKYHPETYAHFGADAELKAWGEVVWAGEKLSGFNADTAVVTEDDENGKLWLQGGMCLEIADPESPGDGTVPLTSSSAPGRAGVKASFEHGRGAPAAAPALHNNVKGYDHQGSYNDKAGRSLFATLYGIVRCAQTVSTQ